MSIFVKVTEVPGTTQEVGLNDGATVSDALTAAGKTVGSNMELTVNGSKASNDTVLSDNARIVIAKSAKGNA